MTISKISVVVLTKDEEQGIANTLDHLRAFEEVIVIDSNSTDRTVEICKSYGARVVNFEWNGGYPKKKQWSLENAGASNDWVLLLDADEYPTSEMVEELTELQHSLASTQKDAFDINLLYRFAGSLLQRGHVVTKRSLLNTRTAGFPEVDDLDAPGIREVEGHYQPEYKKGLGRLKGRLIHDDRDPVSSWFARHNRYSDWEAHLRLNAQARKEIASKRTTKGRVFDSLPFKPALFFLYAYVARVGFLDGRAGFDYALALSMYYWQIELKVRELKRENG